MKKVNTLIVGQGIAGSLAAFMLYLRRVPFMVIDPGDANSSSRIAAGMFTPISGKRKTIHPDVLKQIDFANKVYTQIEELLGATILHLDNIHQVYHSVAEQNELGEKLVNADFAKNIITAPLMIPGVKHPLGAFEITQAGWVDCALLIGQFSNWLRQNDAMMQARFSYQDLFIADKTMKYQELEFNNIIFCEGYQAADNPFFTNENIIPCKGDILTIKYNHLFTDRIIKKNGIYLIPAGDHIFRAGATYQWNNNSVQPDEASKNIIEDKLHSMLEYEYTTIGHQSGIRPTTRTRQVIAKRHPQHKGIFILNGLGTKGVLQGPWWASYIVELLLHG